MDYAQSFIDSYFKRAQMAQQQQQFEEEQQRLTQAQQAQQQYNQMMGQNTIKNDAAIRENAARGLDIQQNEKDKTDFLNQQKQLGLEIGQGATPLQSQPLAAVQAAQGMQGIEGLHNDAQRAAATPQGMQPLQLDNVPVPPQAGPGQTTLANQTIQLATPESKAKAALALELAKKQADHQAVNDDVQSTIDLMEKFGGAKLDPTLAQKVAAAKVLSPEAFGRLYPADPKDNEEEVQLKKLALEYPKASYGDLIQILAQKKHVAEPKDPEIAAKRLLDEQDKAVAPHQKIADNLDDRLRIMSAAQAALASGDEAKMAVAFPQALRAMIEGNVRITPTFVEQMRTSRSLSDTVEGAISKFENGTMGKDQAQKWIGAIADAKKNLQGKKDTADKAITDLRNTKSMNDIQEVHRNATKKYGEDHSPAAQATSADDLLKKHGYLK